MTLQERLADAHQRSVALYLKRNELEEQKAQLQNQGQYLMNQGRAIDMDLVKLDGEIKVLTALIKEAGQANG